MKLSIHLVTYNGSKYIPLLFESLKKQTYIDWELLIFDNNSQDNTIYLIKNELNNFSIQYKLQENKENIGFAGGHNKLYNKTETEYFLILNQDIYLESDCLEKMAEFLDNNNAAAVAPRIMKWLFTSPSPYSFKADGKIFFSDTIDTLGLKVLRNRRVVDKYSQKKWDDIRGKVNLSYRAKNGAMEVFGLSGALAMYRRDALRLVELASGKIFDEDYISYKEDVDLAYRLRISGHSSYILLNAIAYHSRSAGSPEQLHDSVAMVNKREQSLLIKYNSYKNHLANLYANEYWQNFLLDMPWIFWYEIKKFVYFLFFDRQILKGMAELWKNRARLKIKRENNIKVRKINWRQMRRWWI